MRRFCHFATYDVAYLCVRVLFCGISLIMFRPVTIAPNPRPWHTAIASDARTNATAHPKKSRFHDRVVRNVDYCIWVLFRYYHDHAQLDVNSTVQGMNFQDDDDVFLNIARQKRRKYRMILTGPLLCLPKGIGLQSESTTLIRMSRNIHFCTFM